MTAARTAAEAKKTLAKGRYAVFLTDIKLPDMSGVELAKLARQADPDIGLVFATGYPAVPEAVAISGAVVLAKPFGQEDLMRAISLAAIQGAKPTL